jgi:transcriptional regulator with XRE-family HTH domain
MASEASDWRRLGMEVRRSRILAGYDRAEEFAARAGVSARTLLKLERGEHVRMGTVYKIEQALGWRAGAAEDILTGRTSPAEQAASPAGGDEPLTEQDRLMLEMLRMYRGQELTAEQARKALRILQHLDGDE